VRRLWTFAAAALVLSGCGGGGGSTAGTTATPTTVRAATTTLPAPSTTTSTTRPSIEGVQQFAVEAGHTLGPVTYAQVPPVGGLHNPSPQPCGFYDQPVQTERAVHSLEHGAIWVTYRPDADPADVAALSTLARSRNYVLVSPWPQGLPSPVVASAWGLQLQLQSASDPRLAQFVAAYANKGPERDIGC
jgi:hypothetical protein